MSSHHAVYATRCDTEELGGVRLITVIETERPFQQDAFAVAERFHELPSIRS